MSDQIGRTGRMVTKRARFSAVGPGPLACAWVLSCGQIILFVLCLATLALPARADYGAAVAAFQRGHFNEGERLLRACAWRDDDIYCQIDLSDLYFSRHYPSGRQHRSGDADYVESYVWAFLAVHNVNVPGHIEPIVKEFAEAHGLAIELCKRAHDKLAATANQVSQTTPLSKSEPAKAARERIEYILESRGAPGYLRLAELYLGQLPARSNREKRNTVNDSLNKVFSVLDELAAIYDPSGCPSVFGAPAAAPEDGGNVKRNESGEPDQPAVDYKSPLEFAQRADREMKYPPARNVISAIRSQSDTFSAGFSGEPQDEFLYPPGPNQTEPFARWDFDHTVRFPDHLRALSRLDAIFLRRELDRSGEVNRRLLKREIHRALATVVGTTPTKSNFAALRNAFQNQYFDYKPHNYGKLNPWEIVYLIKLSAKSRNLSSLYTLGIMYLDGRGVPLNQRRGEAILTRAAGDTDKPDARAMCELHFIYLTGGWTGIPPNADKAQLYKNRFEKKTNQNIEKYKHRCACYQAASGQDTKYWGRGPLCR